MRRSILGINIAVILALSLTGCNATSSAAASSSDSTCFGEGISEEQDIAQSYLDYVNNNSFYYVDVSGANSNTYPNSIVYQAQKNDTQLYCCSGNSEEALSMWTVMKKECKEKAEQGTYKLQTAASSSNQSVQGVIDGTYTRSDFVNGACLISSTPYTGDSSEIDNIFAGIEIQEEAS